MTPVQWRFIKDIEHPVWENTSMDLVVIPLEDLGPEYERLVMVPPGVALQCLPNKNELLTIGPDGKHKTHKFLSEENLGHIDEAYEVFAQMLDEDDSMMRQMPSLN